jgi:hypothetical protein
MYDIMAKGRYSYPELIIPIEIRINDIAQDITVNTIPGIRIRRKAS